MIYFPPIICLLKKSSPVRLINEKVIRDREDAMAIFNPRFII
jgi:hypothetical protein